MQIQQIIPNQVESGQRCLVRYNDEYFFGTWRPSRFGNKFELSTGEHWRNVTLGDEKLQEIWLS